MKKIMNYALAHYRYENVAGFEVPLQEISVKNAGDETGLKGIVKINGKIVVSEETKEKKVLIKNGESVQC